MHVHAEQRIELKKDTIQGNSELPKVLYIIPWQDTKSIEENHGIKLHNYYEKLLRPLHPRDINIIHQSSVKRESKILNKNK